MARKKTQTKRERLESLINQACHYAEWDLREHGHVPPSAMALTKDGIFLVSPSKIGTESEKDQFADAARMLPVGYRADAVCMILESGAVFAKTPGQDIMNCPPSQSRDRVELVAISGEIKGLSAQQFLMIERDVAGGFSGFSNPMLPKYEELQGRFTGILPPREPKDNQAQMARFALAGLQSASRGALRASEGVGGHRHAATRGSRRAPRVGGHRHTATKRRSASIRRSRRS